MADKAYKTIETSSWDLRNLNLPFAVYEHGTYEESSVLAGQHRRTFLDAYPTLDEAKKAHPDATVSEYSTRVDIQLPDVPPSWFDPDYAGERWDDDH